MSRVKFRDPKRGTTIFFPNHKNVVSEEVREKEVRKSLDAEDHRGYRDARSWHRLYDNRHAIVPEHVRRGRRGRYY